MNKSSSLKDSYFKNNQINDENNIINDSENQPEKILCNHCGRTSNNGIRCLGFCVADSDY
tara:strand:+ start:93 stop:272 length:180 start_codon:yes stop_codon:yes gene_type:complete